MRAWNGWGTGEYGMELPKNGQEFLAQRIGNGHKLPDAQLAEVCAKVPATRLAVSHALISTDAETRVRYARGQSLADWLALRSGEFGLFPDAVAFPESSEQVAELLTLAKEQNLEVIPYGGGTSVAGHINPQHSERPVLTISLERMNKLISFDRESQIATFGAGTPGPLLEQQLRAVLAANSRYAMAVSSSFLLVAAWKPCTAPWIFPLFLPRRLAQTCVK